MTASGSPATTSHGTAGIAVGETAPGYELIDTNGELQYRGAPDADHDDPSLHAQWLHDALDAVLSGATPARPETTPVGCSIKWKP
jgi:hypothetical protein